MIWFLAGICLAAFGYQVVALLDDDHAFLEYSAAQIKWDVASDKPLIMTEFGCEALYGQHGPADVAHDWSEEYQEELYRKNYLMFANIANLRGTCPWVLFDFRSPTRCHPLHQDGWNRKGLVSDKGQRKKAWWVVKNFYESR